MPGLGLERHDVNLSMVTGTKRKKQRTGHAGSRGPEGRNR